MTRRRLAAITAVSVAMWLLILAPFGSGGWLLGALSALSGPVAHLWTEWRAETAIVLLGVLSAVVVSVRREKRTDGGAS